MPTLVGATHADETCFVLALVKWMSELVSGNRMLRRDITFQNRDRSRSPHFKTKGVLMLKALRVLVIALLLPMVGSAYNGRLCVGDRVTTHDHSNGYVQDIFPDGLVKVVIRGVIVDYDIKNVFAPISCLRNICKGAKVTTHDHSNGYVLDIFPDGLVKVVINGVIVDYDIKNVFAPISCLRDICQGVGVKTSDHDNGVVLDIFPDGLVKVAIRGFVVDYNINSVRIARSCLGHSCR
jgi:hypothetical protein